VAGYGRIQRYCPHQGEDLSHGRISDDGKTITCPRHGWTWRLADGVCVQGGNLPIRVEQ
jgi:UDP-MurNAc hydroxylase